ncbi:TBC domain-containing protein [Neolecta irregularis DAH-3]|uniref:TBC domain-containing protein n=1 Tax=Neolecta irregularis (strain DAH-3) TaxID=1198029 RepID=A0A1U7LVY6_NEOID|nr:TBC domain-containing protein [Neolecta irregularis DAH-3]|eukprot:OLL26840.1 TBC domain-containing protein [Neolecta irregularis DAH-3]
MAVYDKAETMSTHSRSSMAHSCKMDFGDDFEDVQLDDVYPRKLPKSASTPFLGRQLAGSRKITPSTMYTLPTTSADHLHSGFREQRRRSTGGSSCLKPHRKTIKELEQECDDDDDVPEDTVFYNVPLSPIKIRSQYSRTYHKALGPDAREITARLAAQTSLTITHYRVGKTQSLPARPSEIVIDPMPISKEKQKILSKTRPSWLPPKSKKEDQKHLAEYERMMKKAVRAGEKKEREIIERIERERSLAETAKVWEKTLIPNWDTAIDDEGVRELWWSGLPPIVRGQVWEKAIGNALALSPNTFQIALDRAKKCNPRRDENSRATFEQIYLDVNATFPGLKIFQTSLKQDLTDLLMVCLSKLMIDYQAYAFYRKDIGYVPGAHLIAAILLLNIPRQLAFIALANILNRPIPLALLTCDTLAIENFSRIFSNRFQKKLPKLYCHLHIALELPVQLYLEPIVLSLFAAHAPLGIVFRICDIYFFEGDRFLLRALLGVISKMEGLLYGDKADVLNIFRFKPRPWDLGKEDEFIQLVRNVGRD